MAHTKRSPRRVKKHKRIKLSKPVKKHLRTKKHFRSGHKKTHKVSSTH